MRRKRSGPLYSQSRPQKQTCTPQRVLSALPPKADIEASSRAMSVHAQGIGRRTTRRNRNASVADITSGLDQSCAPSSSARSVVQTFGLTLAAKDCTTILPFRTTNVSVANSYELSAVSAVHRI